MLMQARKADVEIATEEIAGAKSAVAAQEATVQLAQSQSPCPIPVCSLSGPGCCVMDLQRWRQVLSQRLECIHRVRFKVRK